MKNIFTFLIVCTGLIYHAQARSVRVTGPSEVCPGQEYTYNIGAHFIFGQCGLSRWDIWDEEGNHLDSGFGDSFTYSFPSPDQQFYRITVAAGGGIGCLNSSTNSMIVTTRYPVPTISGPGILCKGESAVFTANANASYMCFHHKYDWEIPGGWTAIFNGDRMTLNVPENAENKNHVIRARLWYDDRNEFGDFRSISIWVGKPKLSYSGTSLVGPTAVYKNSGYRFTGPYVSGANSYEWIVPSDWQIASGQNSRNALLIVGNELGRKTVTHKSKNSCGFIQDSISTMVRTGSDPGGGGQILEPILAVDGNQEYPEANSEDVSLIMYPNPVSKKLNVYIHNVKKKDRSNIYFYDLKGAFINKVEVLGEKATLDVSKYKEGLYFLAVENQNGTLVRRIIVER